MKRFLSNWIRGSLLFSVASLFNARQQSTRESEPTGFLGVGGAADFVSHANPNSQHGNRNHGA